MTTTATATTIHSLAAPLRSALDDLRVDIDAATVRVGDETIDYDSRLGLRGELAGALYRHWHSGSGRREELRDLHRDHGFEELLREATPHRSSKTAAVVRSGPLESPFGRHVLFDVGRVRVRIPESEGPTPLPEIGTRTTLDLPAIRPALSPGFFLVNGSAGGPAPTSPVLRIYLHIDESSAAPLVWHQVLSVLEAKQRTYRAKVLAKASGYPRRDAVVLYLSEESWSAAYDVVAAVAGLPGLNAQHSVLTAPLGGVAAYAWEPKDARLGWDRMSFGQHRTAAIANGLCACVFEGADLHEAVAAALVEANVDPSAPQRNSDSPQWPDAEGVRRD